LYQELLNSQKILKITVYTDAANIAFTYHIVTEKYKTVQSFKLHVLQSSS